MVAKGPGVGEQEKALFFIKQWVEIEVLRLEYFPTYLGLGWDWGFWRGGAQKKQACLLGLSENLCSVPCHDNRSVLEISLEGKG